jgi:hypothetical protein
MLNHVNTVLIGSNCPASYTNVAALTTGDVALFDENKAILTTTGAAAAAKAIYVGVVKGTETVSDNAGTVSTVNIIAYSNAIQKGSKPNMVYSDYIAATEDVISFNLASVVPTVGDRYVLRVVYNDIYEHPGQFTHTYEVIAKTTTPADLVAAFKAKINKHTNRRVNATNVVATTLVITAMTKNDNEGLDSLNYYSQVSMEATMYSQDLGSFILNQPTTIPNLTISKTQGGPGKGNAKIIRDRENAALGYKGIINRMYWPVIKPTLTVDLTATYDTLVIENQNHYLSDDNQYIKNTPLATELYVKAGELVTDGETPTDSVLKDMIEAFVAIA